MSCRQKTLGRILAVMDTEKSMYTIIRDSGVSHMTVQRALAELERSGKVQQITNAVGQVYPRWVRI